MERTDYPRTVRCISNRGEVAEFNNGIEVEFDLTIGELYVIVGEETDKYGRFYELAYNDSDEPCTFYRPEMFEEID